MRVTFLKILSMALLIAMLPFGTARAQYYFGAKAGPVRFDVDTGSVDEPLNIAAVAGYRFSPRLGLESELGYTLAEGSYSVDFSSFGAGTLEEDLTIGTAAVYGTFRAGGGAVYFKSKGGYAYETVKVGPDREGAGHFSYGIGIGWALGDGSQLEIEYTVIEEDVNFLSVGVNF